MVSSTSTVDVTIGVCIMLASLLVGTSSPEMRYPADIADPARKGKARAILRRGSRNGRKSQADISK